MVTQFPSDEASGINLPLPRYKTQPLPPPTVNCVLPCPAPPLTTLRFFKGHTANNLHCALNLYEVRVGDKYPGRLVPEFFFESGVSDVLVAGMVEIGIFSSNGTWGGKHVSVPYGLLATAGGRYIAFAELVGWVRLKFPSSLPFLVAISALLLPSFAFLCGGI